MKSKQIIILKERWSKKKCRNICEDDVLFKELEEVEGFFKLDKEAFVGIYTSSIQNGKVTIYCCPKYFDFDLERPYTEMILNNVKEHMNLVCFTIEQLRKEGRNFEDSEYQFSAYDNYSEKKSVNAYELADFILNDYVKNGLFYHRNKQQKINSKGPVNWTKTVSKLQPIIDKNEVIYTKVINQHSTKDYSQLLTSIHRYIVNKCADFLQPLGKYENIGLPECTYEFSGILEDYYNYVLTQLSYVYTNRDIALLKALASWCGMSNFYKAFGGVTCFDRVWEYVTKKVWGNIDETRSEKPNYYIGSKSGEEQVYEGNGGEIPDIIRVVKNDSEICIGIFDAKYYYPWKIDKYKKNASGCIWGIPANSDIVKQIAYYNNFKNTYGEKLHYANVFLMPEFSNDMCSGLNIEKMSSLELYKFRGYVESGTNNSVQDVLLMSGYNMDDVKKSDDIVEIFTVNPETLYKQYLSEQRNILDNKIYEDFIKKYEDLICSKKSVYSKKFKRTSMGVEIIGHAPVAGISIYPTIIKDEIGAKLIYDILCEIVSKNLYGFIPKGNININVVAESTSNNEKICTELALVAMQFEKSLKIMNNVDKTDATILLELLRMQFSKGKTISGLDNEEFFEELVEVVRELIKALYC